MKQIQHLSAFEALGDILNDCLNNSNSIYFEDYKYTLYQSEIYNPWFTEVYQKESLKGLLKMLKPENLQNWLSHYDLSKAENSKPKKILVIMAGNIPMVNFHDFISVLFSGNIFLGKLSSQDKFWMPFLGKILCKIEPEYKNRIIFTEEIVKEKIDAVIATGSDNSSRYFEYYFSKYPNIIRKNRNSVAILKGDENQEELRKLCDDIFLYYGLGCRNIAKLLIPANFELERLLKAIEVYSPNPMDNTKYKNNYEYRKSILLLNNTPHYDTGNLLLIEDKNPYSTIATLHYEFYIDLNTLELPNPEKIQCIVSNLEGKNFVKIGNAQSPGLLDYPDGIDTMAFLLGLYQS